VIRTSLFVSMTVLLLVLFGLMSRLDFLAPWKRTLFLHCGKSIAIFLVVFGINLFAATLAINRKILLKDTGRKLTHFDNQLQAGGPESQPPFLGERRWR
jgi:hypothetical protein